VKHDDTGLSSTGFTIDQRHTDDVAWVGKLPRKMAFKALYFGDKAVTSLAVYFITARHGCRRVSGPGIARAKPSGRA
jgi:hypothetical protein